MSRVGLNDKATILIIRGFSKWRLKKQSQFRLPEVANDIGGKTARVEVKKIPELSMHVMFTKMAVLCTLRLILNFI